MDVCYFRLFFAVLDNMTCAEKQKLRPQAETRGHMKRYCAMLMYNVCYK